MRISDLNANFLNKKCIIRKLISKNWRYVLSSSAAGALTIWAMKIGQVIRNLRLAKKATLEDIAFVAEMDAANLSRIERGKQNPTPEITEKLAMAFNLPVSSLYLMAEQTAAPYAITGSKEEIKQVTRRLEDFVVQFMLLSPENQQLVNEFISVMLKFQRKSK